MAEISVTDVTITRTNPQDFGSPTGGNRVYMLRYGLPGVPGMEDQVHIIPMAALTNHRLDTGETDPMASMQAMLQDYMAMHQTVVEMGQREAQINPNSYLVKSTVAVQALHTDLDVGAQTLAASVPMVNSDDAHATVQETFLDNATPSKIAKMKSGVSVFKGAVGKLQVCRSDYVTAVSPMIEEHPVDTSVTPWSTLTQAIADDTDEFAREQAAWFEYRFGRHVRFIAEQRLADARKAAQS